MKYIKNILLFPFRLIRLVLLFFYGLLTITITILAFLMMHSLGCKLSVDHDYNKIKNIFNK